MTNLKVRQFEFIALMASLMSVVALAIDALLPALNYIGISVGTTGETQNQLIISMIFLGLGIGPLIFGPLSDSLGRKPIVYLGFILFVIASFICVQADSLEMMIVGRIIQGVGLSAPRTISIAMIRDTYSGDYMARIMSFVTVIFLLVPTMAPAMGQFVLNHYSWRAIFYTQLLLSVIVSLWFWRRQPETLPPRKRIKFSWHLLWDGAKEIVKYKSTMGYTIISGFITGSFIVYLSASQHIFQEQYGLVDQFPFIFAGLAVSIGTATFLNGSIVVKIGMKRLVRVALLLFFAASLVYTLLFAGSSNPPVGVLFTFFAIQFFAVGFLFGNLRALAMEPVGHIAGIGAAITGFISTIMAVPISTYIGKYVVDTAHPVFVGFTICSAISLVIMYLLRNVHEKAKEA